MALFQAMPLLPLRKKAITRIIKSVHRDRLGSVVTITDGDGTQDFPGFNTNAEQAG
ncbi:hypothetical protein [Aliikangiella coralliicola]|uniref:hypothetical protein n=1 Tax=Aliikangiella coralliicola TaxID=2592383 RepID=UPI00143DDE7A|nr:hypothetical protein [Aliikangiella coralliicola]